MELLRPLIGKKVTVFTLTGTGDKQDVGLLEELDSGWLRLRKGEHDVMFFPIHQIRLVKPFEPL